VGVKVSERIEPFVVDARYVITPFKLGGSRFRVDWGSDYGQ